MEYCGHETAEWTCYHRRVVRQDACDLWGAVRANTLVGIVRRKFGTHEIAVDWPLGLRTKPQISGILKNADYALSRVIGTN